MTSAHISQDGTGGAPIRATDVRLRDVERADLELFFAFEQDPEAARRAVFPSRERERFMTHWENRVLGDPTGIVRTVLADGEVAGNIVSWEDEGRRLVGYWLGRAFWGRGIGGRPGPVPRPGGPPPAVRRPVREQRGVGPAPGAPRLPPHTRPRPRAPVGAGPGAAGAGAVGRGRAGPGRRVRGRPGWAGAGGGPGPLARPAARARHASGWEAGSCGRASGSYGWVLGA